MEGFDESVLDIVGLSVFEARTLPEWLRRRLRTQNYRMVDDNPDDQSLVDNGIATWGFSAWLGEWGRAVIDGQRVFICESDALLEPVTLADEIGCGVMLVDPSSDQWNYTICFTEKRLQRRLAKRGALACVHFGV